MKPLVITRWAVAAASLCAAACTTLVTTVLTISPLVSPTAAQAADKASPAAAPGVVVIVTKAETACFSSAVRVNGLLMARSEAMVIPEVDTGFKVNQVLAREGDRVSAGQSLARLTRADGVAVTVRAPVNGVVIKSNATLGALASAKSPDPLFRIAVDGEIELMAEVPSIYLPKLSAGQTARVELEEGREIPGRVRLVPSEINPVSQLGQVRVSIENDPSLRVGTFARAVIDAARSCGVSVPRSAVHFRTEGATVQVVRNKTVETRTVQVGLVSESGAEIRDGIKEGEVVIANAGGSLRNGEKVRPMARDETTGQLEER
ncbi:MAG: efflux RND transporter periplasmic adaptor subunit [Rhodoplanes sp.]|uniref:efflux RND transporter periplasmic adaptor subunit n=1 Tax=Rhodoplanes sp. TaxID=1968906 RepID=UPI0017B113AA|nr:efflux RND transporter periplasmic adaptor subunit [Rhodoplanes sp.]NVO17213.1 efflux RND transporter periplasmic adaptor subunit [Rhodoplanes sp.]